MSDHPSHELLAQYAKRALPPADFLEVHRHLLACSVCDEKCSSPQQMKEDYSTLRAALLPQSEETPYHLSADEASGYITQRLDPIDLEIVESHLELCDTCTEMVRSLKEEAEASIVAQPSNAGAGRKAAWQVLSSNTSVPTRMRWGRVAALAAAVCIMLGAALLVWLKLFNRPEVARTPQPGAIEPARDNSNANSSSNARGQQSAQGNSNETENNAPPDSAPDLEQTPSGELLVLNDQGRKLSLDKNGNLSGADQIPPNLQQSIKLMLSTERVPRAAVPEELKEKRGTLLGDGGNGEPFRLLSPVGKIVLDNRPSFTWQPLAGASSYRVTIVDARLNEVMTSGQLTATSWKPARPLGNGNTYSWQVTAIKDGKQVISPVLPSPPARFKILGQGQAVGLKQARKAYANSHLALAVLYARAGLRDEAEAELRALLSANPQSKVVRNLLRDIRR